LSVSTERAPDSREFGRGAAVLSVGIAATGVVTYAYFALASHALTSSATPASVESSVDFMGKRPLSRPDVLSGSGIIKIRARGHSGA